MNQNRRNCRNGEPCQPRTLLEAIYCLVHHSAADAATIAERIAVRRGYLLDAANPDREDIQFQARLIEPASAAASNDVVVEFLCRLRGGVFVRTPSFDLEGAIAITQGHLEVIREIGEDAAKVHEILRDRKLTADEADEFDAEIDDTMQKLAEWKAIVRAHVGKEIK